MPNNIKMTKYNDLQNFTEKIFKVNMIDEKIYAYNANDKVQEAFNDMKENNFDIMAIEKDNEVIGYLDQEDLNQKNLKEDSCYDHVKNIKVRDTITRVTSFKTLFKKFKKRSWLLILSEDEISHIVTKADLQKQPVRMYIFSLVSLLEMKTKNFIENNIDNWEEKISSGRLNKAKNTYNKMKEENEELQLIEAIQLCDIKTILGSKKARISKIGFPSTSKTEFKRIFGKIEDLRNDIAHSQDIIKKNRKWKDVFGITETIENILCSVEEMYCS